MTPPDSRAAVLRHAATVMLLREAAAGVEVLVIRRHQNLAFMGGMWVFPGGALAQADMSSEALERIPPDSRDRCSRLKDASGAALDLTHCLGLAVAAYRETFEETGVLLATDAAGRYCNDDVLSLARTQRSAIAAEPDAFPTLLNERRMYLDIDRLLYWAHWVTPSNAPKRFDTRFFVMAAPAEQIAAIDTIEAVECAWMTPAALLASEHSAMPISQPTRYNLMELQASLSLHGSLAAMLKAEADRLVPPIMPKMLREKQTLIVLPWDPEYAQLPGAGVPNGIDYPERLRNLPSRALLR